MNRIALAILAFVLMPGRASCGTPLNELIDRNVRDANTAYQKSLPGAQLPASPVFLWIHVRNEGQESLAQQILNEMVKIPSDQWTIEPKPVQKVDSGPSRSQLRYFKQQERQQAQVLLAALRTLIPQLDIADLSGTYENAEWIQQGHYELWLAPDLTNLQPIPR
jgi:hypothetical protein